MTDEERSERIAKEKKARADAVGLLCQSLQVAGVPICLAYQGECSSRERPPLLWRGWPNENDACGVHCL